ncbi:hypothetical protein DPMN_081372 [Dreissena polymorpha]|uniref:Uncharacterized protein n=1 Tax=Dreissena polymorpha TaxID=45954 RepID=A0A9D3Y4T8_DREPO|nr:hypothetical protein DPMN_081372 [Dreissena polymorpha]
MELKSPSHQGTNIWPVSGAIQREDNVVRSLWTHFSAGFKVPNIPSSVALKRSVTGFRGRYAVLLETSSGRRNSQTVLWPSSVQSGCVLV